MVKKTTKPAQFTVRLPVETLVELVTLAQLDGRPLANYAAHILTLHAITQEQRLADAKRAKKGGKRAHFALPAGHSIIDGRIYDGDGKMIGTNGKVTGLKPTAAKKGR